jgi:hypothetical protein
MTTTMARYPRLALLLLATAVACKPADKSGQPASPPELSGDAKVALDSGNVLFRSGSALDRSQASADAKKAYAAALEQYQLAAKRAPKHAAPYFGIYMTAGALGDSALAETALKGIRDRGGEMPPGAMHVGAPPPTAAPGKFQ